MAGAVMQIDQDRPGPSVSSGTPGVARKDLWTGFPVRATSTLPSNSSQQWTLLDKPPTSTAVLNNADQITCDFTPDVPGSYRLRLVTNNGGAGNQQTLIVGVSKDNTGTTIFRGWRVPAYGERSGESNWPGNLRGWAEAINDILVDLKTVADSLNVADATTLIKGIVQLAGDLRGTATAPLVKSVSGDSGGTATGTYTKVDETGQQYMKGYRRPGSALTLGNGSNNDILLFAIPDNDSVTVEAEVTFQDATAAILGLVKMTAQFSAAAGVATIKGTITTFSKNDTNLTVTLTTDGANGVILRFFDDAANALYVGWEVYIQRMKVT